VENLTFPLYRPSFLFYLVCTPCTPMFVKKYEKCETELDKYC